MVLSYSLWQRCFQRDPQICGKTIWLTDKSYTVLGVTPKNFSGVRRFPPVDIWCPTEVWGGMGKSSSFSLMGRLAPGIGVKETLAEVDMIVHRLGINLSQFRTGR